jgi:hypothetical protein
MNGNLIATSAGLLFGIAWDRVFGWYLVLNTTKASKKFGEDLGLTQTRSDEKAGLRGIMPA